MSKVNPLKGFFEMKSIQKFYKKACDPKNANFYNNTLPTLETLLSTCCYMVATEKQKDIPKEQKHLLQVQNVLSGIVGMGIGSYLNRKITKFTNELAPKIDKNICDVHKVAAGLKIVGPLIMTGLTMRMLMPTVIAQVSSMYEDHRRAKNKLDVKA